MEYKSWKMLGRRDNMGQKIIQGYIHLLLRSVANGFRETLEMGHRLGCAFSAGQGKQGNVLSEKTHIVHKIKTSQLFKVFILLTWEKFLPWVFIMKMLLDSENNILGPIAAVDNTRVKFAQLLPTASLNVSQYRSSKLQFCQVNLTTQNDATHGCSSREVWFYLRVKFTPRALSVSCHIISYSIPMW